MNRKAQSNGQLAAAITKAASKQTWYRAYGYFHWVDDVIDAESNLDLERTWL